MSELGSFAESEIRAARSWLFALVSLHPKSAVAVCLIVGAVAGFSVHWL